MIMPFLLYVLYFIIISLANNNGFCWVRYNIKLQVATLYKCTDKEQSMPNGQVRQSRK